MNKMVNKLKEFANLVGNKTEGTQGVYISGTGQVFVTPSSIASAKDKNVSRQIEAAKRLKERSE